MRTLIHRMILLETIHMCVRAHTQDYHTPINTSKKFSYMKVVSVTSYIKFYALQTFGNLTGHI